MQIVKENPISIAFGIERDSAMDRGDLANLSAFVTVADQRSFRAAASRLDVTPSALSHSMRQLEARLGVRLLNRTTRSVSVTDAGQRLLEQLRPALGQISDALEDLNRERSRPFGRLRIYATNMAGAGVIAPVWQRFLSTYPEVHLELGRYCGQGIRRRCRTPGPCGRRYGRRQSDGTAQSRRGRRAVLLRAAPQAAHPGRSRPSQLRAISPGHRWRGVRVAI
jgi:DNA-binding transcriptional LysR family regulator